MLDDDGNVLPATTKGALMNTLYRLGLITEHIILGVNMADEWFGEAP